MGCAFVILREPFRVRYTCLSEAEWRIRATVLLSVDRHVALARRRQGVRHCVHVLMCESSRLVGDVRCGGVAMP